MPSAYSLSKASTVDLSEVLREYNSVAIYDHNSRLNLPMTATIKITCVQISSNWNGINIVSNCLCIEQKFLQHSGF